VASEAARRNIYLEINASPERLDLSSALVRTAKSLGAKFAISTDSHQTKHLGFNMPFGVIMARRGWLGAVDILNTLTLKQLYEANILRIRV
jgi:DNA polymerase (family 10)